MRKRRLKSAGVARKGDVTRRRVIERAAPILNNCGFAGTAMSDLMAATGLKKGGLYRHFTSKEELALESLRYALEIAQHSKFDCVDPSADGIDQLIAFVRNFTQNRSPMAGGCPILNTSAQQGGGAASLRREAALSLARWITRLADMVRLSQRNRTMNRHADAQSVALMILATLEGALAINRLTPRAASMRVCGDFLESWIEGFRT